MIQGEDDLSVDGADVDGLTVAERAELDAEAAEATAPKQPEQAAAEPEIEPEPEKPDATAEALQSLAQQQARTADVLAAVANKVLPEQQPAAQQEPEPTKEPDWEAMRAELKAKHKNGDLEDDAYEDAREALIEQRAEWRATAAAEARIAQQRKQDSDSAWDRSLNAFLGRAENSSFLADSATTAVFNTYLSQVFGQNPGASYDALLSEAMKLTQERFGVATKGQSQQAKDAIEKEVQKRRAEAGKVPPDLSRAPQAGTVATDRGDKYQSLDDLDIDSLEDRLARMPDAEVDDYLATAPGGLLDNPRAA